jgi:hypothetical protein
MRRQSHNAANKTVVLNADDQHCRQLIDAFPADCTSVFSFSPRGRAVKEHLQRGGVAFCLVQSGEPRIVRLQGRRNQTVISIAELPSAWGGQRSP